jgi:hypothetical protein
MAVAVKNQGKAAEALQEVLALFPQTSISELSGLKYYGVPALQSTFITPTIALDEGHLLIGRDAAEMDRLRQAAKSGETLESSPTFTPVKTTYRSANEVFAYVDTRVIFERGFPFVRQIAPFTVQMSGLGEMIDPEKIPDTETIAKHLSPIVYAQTRLPDGYLVESNGPITLTHAILIGASVGSSFSKPPGR